MIDCQFAARVQLFICTAMSQVASIRDVELSQSDLLQLLKISFILVHVFAHDSNAALTVIHGYSEIMTESLAETAEVPDINQLGKFLSEVTGAAERLADLIQLCLMFTRVEGQNLDAAVSNVYTILSTVARSYPNSSIDFGTSSKDLEIIYPGPLLFGMTNGLLGNAVRHGGSETIEIKVDWQVERDRLVLNVHDAGNGITSLPERGMVPIEELGVSVVKGLELINRIAVQSGGLLLFCRSSVLGGLHIHLEIPVPYYSDSVNHAQPPERSDHQ